MKKIYYAFLTTFIGLTPLVAVVSCSTKDSKQTQTPTAEKSGSTTKTPTAEKSDVEKTKWLQSKIITKLNESSDLTKENVFSVLKAAGLNIKLEVGTSLKSKIIGDKYGDITDRFIPTYKTLSDKEKQELTFESFSALFENEGNKKYKIAQAVLSVLNDAFDKKDSKQTQTPTAEKSD